MAELAIPLIALGSMYVISNQDKKKILKTKEIENFSVMNKYTSSNANNEYGKLPNIDKLSINYPVESNNIDDNVKGYHNPNQFTDKYFNNSQQIEKLINNNQEQQQISSLSGNMLSNNEFTHNNMTPYFGSRIRGANLDNQQESILDNMQGNGSQQIRKQEIGTLFKPEENMQWSYGAPNQSDFYQSRMNTSLRKANEKPWDEIQVGPGINKGYECGGNGGFNSGLESRDSWMPKNVDELRVNNNPKLTYNLSGYEGPANNIIKERGSIGKVEKYLPEKYYANTPDKWLTTTGIEKAQTARGEHILQNASRISTTSEYYGNSSNTFGEATYAPQNFVPGFRKEKQTCDLPAPSMLGKNPSTDSDYGIRGYTSLPNNRNVTCREEVGIVSGIMKAAIAPLLDVLKPTRKDNVIGNARQYENAGSIVPSGVVFNPADRTKTTNREMQESKLDNNHNNLERQQANAYLVTEQQAINNNRDTTTCQYIGNSGGSGIQSNTRVYEAEYNQRNNVIKTDTIYNRTNMGNTQIFNQIENIKIDKRDNDRNNNRLWVPSTGPTVPTAVTSIDTYGQVKMPQSYNFNIETERNTPDILSAFKNNPYTHSLSSYY
jgi:hypothetical protein